MIEKTSTGMNQGMINKLVTVLETTLSKLSRYDEGSLIGSILSFTVFPFRSNNRLSIEETGRRPLTVGLTKTRTHHSISFLTGISQIVFQKVSGSGKEMGQAYVNFTRNCMDQIRSKVLDELWILTFFEVRNKRHESAFNAKKKLNGLENIRANVNFTNPFLSLLSASLNVTIGTFTSARLERISKEKLESVFEKFVGCLLHICIFGEEIQLLKFFNHFANHTHTHAHTFKRITLKSFSMVYVFSNGTRRRYRCCVTGCPRDSITACTYINVPA